MTGEIEAAGELITGGLIGRAVEPRAGEHAGGDHDSMCLNCGTALVGPHCHQCGQGGHVHRSLGAIGHEILHGVVHFEGKLWRTLPKLAFRPGELTRRYIAGERARFVSPMALFLFSVFTLFAVFSLLGVDPLGKAEPKSPETVQERVAELRESRAELVAGRDKFPDGNPGRAAMTAGIAGIDADIERVTQGENAGGTHSDTGIKWLDHGVEKMSKNPALTLYKLQSNSYKFSWLLIPLSLPFVWLLFAWKRQFHLYDHAVFITYSISFMSLFFIVLSLLGAVGISGVVVGLASTFVPPVHIYKQLKGAYGLSRFGALLRTVVLLFFALIVLILFMLIVLAMGAAH